MMKYVPNVVTFMLTMGWKWWYLVEACISPNVQPDVCMVEKALAF